MFRIRLKGYLVKSRHVSRVPLIAPLLVCGVVASVQAQSEVAIENMGLRLAATPGQSGVAVYAKSGVDGKRLELAVLRRARRRRRPFVRSSLRRAIPTGKALRVSTGNAEAEFTLGVGGIVTIRPGKNAASVEVRTGARYAILPDFFADDVVFDPVHLAMPTLTVPAENFLLQFLEGGNTM